MTYKYQPKDMLPKSVAEGIYHVFLNLETPGKFCVVSNKNNNMI